MKRARRLALQERIRRCSVVDERTGCWLWKCRLNNQGYPVMNVHVPNLGHRKLFAHRVSLEVFKRPPRAGEEGAHDPVKCPHKHCVNPAHLRWATRSENERDKRHPSRLRLREVHPPVHSLGLEA